MAAPKSQIYKSFRGSENEELCIQTESMFSILNCDIISFHDPLKE